MAKSQKSSGEVPVVEGVVQIADDLVEFTRDIAEELETLPKFVGDRGFKVNHKNFLSQEMKSGRFLGNLLHILTCNLGKVEINLNLKHTCAAALEQDPGWKAPGLARKIVFKAKDEDALRRIYALVDGGAGRTFSDRVVAATYGKKEFDGITKSDIFKLIPGYRHYKVHTTGSSNLVVSSQVVSGAMLDDDLDACLAIKDLIQSYSPDRASRWQAFVTYALFMTYLHHKDHFRAFWIPVLRRDLPAPDSHELNGESDPRARLAQLIESRKLGAKGDTIGLAKMKIYCLWAYIRWARGEKISKLACFSAATHMDTKGKNSIYEQFKDPSLNVRRQGRKNKNNDIDRKSVV